MSGWGKAENKQNKLVFECETIEEAEVVAENARVRGDMKYVSIRETKPYYDEHRFFVQFKNKKTYPTWYKKDSFRQ